MVYIYYISNADIRVPLPLHIHTAFPGFKVGALARDGRRIPPIVPGGGQSKTCAASKHAHPENTKVRNLTKTMKNREDPSLS